MQNAPHFTQDSLLFVAWCLPFIGVALGYWWSFVPVFLIVAAIRECGRELAEMLGFLTLAALAIALVSALAAIITSSVFGFFDFEAAFTGIFAGLAFVMACIIART